MQATEKLDLLQPRDLASKAFACREARPKPTRVFIWMLWKFSFGNCTSHVFSNKHGAILVSEAPEASCRAFVAWDYCHWLKFSREALQVDNVGGRVAGAASEPVDG